MKPFLVILLFLSQYSYAQKIKETKDKFQNLTSYCLEDMIDLDVGDVATTSDFELNVYKIIKDSDTIYAFNIITETDLIIKCPEESECIILYNDSSTIELYSVNRTYEVFKRTVTTAFQIPVRLEDLIALKDAKKIQIKIYCDGAAYEARFRKEDLKEFKNGIKMLTK